MLSHQGLGATPRQKLKKANIYTDDTPALVDVFMPRDDALDTDHEGNETVIDREQEKVKCFCVMNKLLEHCLKVNVRVSVNSNNDHVIYNKRTTQLTIEYDALH